MARIRNIKPQFFKDADLFDAEQASGLPLRVAYAGLWTVADRKGRFRWKPREIKTDILPYDNLDMSAVMEALEKYGFIFKYKAAGLDYGFIPNFEKHQFINRNEAKSTLPEPSENSNAQRLPNSASTDDAKPPLIHRETSRLLDTDTDVSTRSKASDEPEGFPEWYDAYPRKVGKIAAAKAYWAALKRPDATRETLLAAAKRYAAANTGQEQKFIAHPKTWLNAGRWLDTPEPVPRPNLLGFVDTPAEEIQDAA